MTEYQIEILSYIVKPKGEAIFCEMATIIEREDEAGGEFVVIKQTNDATRVAVEESDWPLIKQAVENLLKIGKENEQK